MLVSAFLCTHPVTRAAVLRRFESFLSRNQEFYIGSFISGIQLLPITSRLPIQTRPATGDQVTLNQEIIHEYLGCQQRRPSLELTQIHTITSFGIEKCDEWKRSPR